MKNPLVRKVSKWMLRAYILWSICADITLLSGIIYLVFWDQIYTEVTMKEVENCNGLRGSTGRLHHKPYGGETGFDMQTIDDWSYRLVTL